MYIPVCKYMDAISVREVVDFYVCLPVFFLLCIHVCLYAVGKAVELNKQRSPKQLSQPAFGIPEQSDSSASNSGRIRGNQLSEGSDSSTQSLPSTTSPIHSSPTGQASDTSGQDSDASKIYLFLFCTTFRDSGDKILKMYRCKLILKY